MDIRYNRDGRCSLYVYSDVTKIGGLEINDKWQQVVFYNPALQEGREWPYEFPQYAWIRAIQLKKIGRESMSHSEKYLDKSMGDGMNDFVVEAAVGVDLGKDLAFGGLGLKSDKQYYVYDFWNDRLVGKYHGSDRLEQDLRPHEARMMSIHEVEANPQFISTNRHILQGYVDMDEYPTWDEETGQLKGISRVIGQDIYKIVIAGNGYLLLDYSVSGKARCSMEVINEEQGLYELLIDTDESNSIVWTVRWSL